MTYKPDRNVEKMGIMEKERFSIPYEEKINGPQGISLSPSYFHGLTKNQKALALVGALLILGAVSVAGCTTTSDEKPVNYSERWPSNRADRDVKTEDTSLYKNCDVGYVCYVGPEIGYNHLQFCTDRPDLVKEQCGFVPNYTCNCTRHF